MSDYKGVKRYSKLKINTKNSSQTTLSLSSPNYQATSKNTSYRHNTPSTTLLSPPKTTPETTLYSPQGPSPTSEDRHLWPSQLSSAWQLCHGHMSLLQQSSSVLWLSGGCGDSSYNKNNNVNKNHNNINLVIVMVVFIKQTC